MFRVSAVVAWSVLAATAAISIPVRAGDLDEKLLQQAPQILKFLEDKGYGHVGVLKFRIQKDNRAPSDGVGTLNLDLALKLTTALGLKSPNKNEKVVLLRDASAVAATIAGASHTTAEGRQKLFTASYPRAWGTSPDPVPADAFLTGVIVVSPDRRDMTVGILVFDRQTGKLERVVPNFTVQVDSEILAGIGESFHLRGAPVSGQVSVEAAEADAIKSAAQVKAKGQAHPLDDTTAPVALSILYDGKPVPVEFVEGEARVPEPRDGQRVSFVVRRQGKSRDRLAVVLKVNGESTLFRERKPEINCAKWILEPEAQAITVTGYQLDKKRQEQFRVLSRAESEQSEVYYGADVGLISLVIFREDTGEAPTPVLLPPEQQFLAEDLAALTISDPLKSQPRNLAAFKFQAREIGKGTRGLATRGLIGQGEEAALLIRDVTFRAAPVSVLTATVRYYKK